MPHLGFEDISGENSGNGFIAQDSNKKVAISRKGGHIKEKRWKGGMVRKKAEKHSVKDYCKAGNSVLSHISSVSSDCG